MNIENVERKLNHDYSFGRESFENPQHHFFSEDKVKENSNKSISFDFENDLRQYGLEIVNASENELPSLEKNDSYFHIPKTAFKRFINSIKENVLSIKQEANKIKQSHLDMLSGNTIKEIVEWIKNKIISNQFSGENEVEEFKMLEEKFSKENNKGKVLARPSINISISEESESEDTKSSKEYLFDKIFNANEMKSLKFEIGSKISKIGLLEGSLEAVKSLSDKKESYFKEMLMLKELEWDRKTPSASEFRFQANVRNSENYETQRYMKENQILSEDYQKSFLKDNNRIITKRVSEQSLLSMNGGESRKAESKSRRSSHFRTESMCITMPTLEKMKKENNEFETKMSSSFKNPNERRQRTDSSFQRVSEKIKNFENSITGEMRKLYI